MALFLARVELHGVKPEEYGPLHNAMAKQGFARIITNGADERHLPHGNYIINFGETSQEVLLKAKIATDAVHPDAGILVTHAEAGTFHNLKEVVTIAPLMIPSGTGLFGGIQYPGLPGPI